MNEMKELVMMELSNEEEHLKVCEFSLIEHWSERLSYVHYF